MNANEKYKKCLNAIYEDCTNEKINVTRITDFSETYGTNSNLGTVMSKLGIVKKENGIYHWKMRKPDDAMIISIRTTLNNYNNASKTKTASDKLIKANFNFDTFIDVFDLLPKDKLSKNERVNIAKKMIDLTSK